MVPDLAAHASGCEQTRRVRTDAAACWLSWPAHLAPELYPEKPAHEQRRGSDVVATLEECRTALSSVADRLSTLDPQVRSRHAADRTVSLRLTDLGTGFRGQLSAGELVDVCYVDGAVSDDARAQVRLSCTSDDLLALMDGSLPAGTAWATGRLRVEASPLDLLRLGTML